MVGIKRQEYLKLMCSSSKSSSTMPVVLTRHWMTSSSMGRELGSAMRSICCTILLIIIINKLPQFYFTLHHFLFSCDVQEGKREIG